MNPPAVEGRTSPHYTPKKLWAIAYRMVGKGGGSPLAAYLWLGGVLPRAGERTDAKVDRVPVTTPVPTPVLPHKP